MHCRDALSGRHRISVAPCRKRPAVTWSTSILLSGEIDVLLDSNEVVHMKAGDVIVMRGVTHCWINRSDQPAVTAFILLDAQPIETDGETLRPLYPAHLEID